MKNKKAVHFFNNVIIRLGYYGWTLRLVPNSSEGYCWIHSKTIDIGEKFKDKKELIIHEISHIDTCRFCNNRHHKKFWKRYEDLMLRFLPDCKPSSRYNESGGFIKVCYDNLKKHNS